MMKIVVSWFFLVILLVGCGGGGSGNATTANSSNASIPNDAIYSIQINGEGFFGGFRTAEPFIRNAALVIVPTIDNSNLVKNGVNPVDVGFYTADSPLIGIAGALYFGTNTALSRLINSTLAASAIDTSFVRINASNGNKQIIVGGDGNIAGLPNARLDVFNIYNIQTSQFASVYNILTGQIIINFSEDNQVVTGEIRLGGTSGISSGFVTSEYVAVFSGNRVE